MVNNLNDSRFATVEDVFSEEYSRINSLLLTINKELELVDHSELNLQRFDWAHKIIGNSQFYASRFWEYPFAIIASDLQYEMKCADIGCGTTPFTAYLADAVGPLNVTGIDSDLLSNDSKSHFAFGVRNNFINKIGVNFINSSIQKLSVADNAFDRVFCISVIEHIEDPLIRLNGIREMARILKPGGRLILTMDLGINTMLTNPMEVLLYSGLIPFGSVDYKWPQKRFVNLQGVSMDVFGMVLYKPDVCVYNDSLMREGIEMYRIFEKYIPRIYSEKDRQIITDINRKFGLIRFLIKKILNRY